MSTRSAQSVGTGSVLSELIDEMTERLNRGDAVDVEAYVERYPELATPLRHIHQTLALLREPSAASSAPPAPAGDADVPGRLGDFRVGRELGRGGMGIVYEAEQISLGRKVALKVLPFAGLLDPRQRNRFRNEARAAASLHHPHIVPVYAVGEDRGVHFYAMQLVEGQSLAEFVAELRETRDKGRESRVRGGVRSEDEGTGDREQETENSQLRTPHSALDTQAIAALSTEYSTSPKRYFRRVAEIGIRIAEALDHAHEMGVVHRDVKPSNLLIDASGHVWITDFGLAATDGKAPTLTLSGDIVGTLRYMSPEQAEGKRALVDRRTDIYSLGVTLYELATLRPAFAEENRGRLLRQILEENPRPPRRAEPTVPRDLETIILKAIDKHPSARYDTAAELADDLRRFLAQRPILARRTGRLHRTWQWARRNPVVALTTAIAACLLAVLAVAGPLVALREARLNRDLRLREYVASIGLAASEIEFGKIERAYGILDRYRSSDLRGYEWHLLHRMCQRQRIGTELRPGPPGWINGGTIRDVAFSPDGNLLATANWSNHVRLWDVRSRTVKHLLRIPGKPLSVEFSADGSLLAAGTELCQFHVWDVPSGALVQTEAALGETSLPWQDAWLTVRGVAFSPDGQWLVTAVGLGDSSRREPEGEGAVCLWRRTEETEKFVLEKQIALPSSATAVAASPDRLEFIVGCSDGTLRGYGISDGNESFRIDAHTLPVRSVAYSPDGHGFASASYDQTVKLWNASDQSPIRTLVGHAREVHDVAFSEDGRYLVSASFDRSIQLWEVESGQAVKTLWGHSGPVWCVASSPTGDQIASGAVEDAVRLWPVDRAMPRGTDIVNLNSGAWGLTFSADGRRVAACTESGQLWIGDAASGRTLALLNDDACVGALVFSPDGRLLVRGGGTSDLGYDRPAGGEASPTYGDLTVWDTSTMSEVARRTAHGAAIRGVHVLPAGDHLLSISVDGSVIQWELPDLRAHKEIRLPNSPVYSAALSPDGRQLALGMQKIIEIWREEHHGWQLWRTLDAHADWVAGVAFSPDGHLLASASPDGTTAIWDIERAAPPHVLAGDASWRMSVAFSRDGRTLAVANRDHTVKLYHVETRSELLTLKGHDNGVLAVAFSPIENLLVSSATGGTLRFWRTQ